MPLESANFIDGLIVTNPPGTDLKSQGDDHLQLIKKVLKNTFPNATRPFPIPTSSTKTGDSGVAAGDQNSLILVNNTAVATLTMPALATTDAGWSITVLKLTTSTAPLFIAPPSGNITSGQTTVPKARRNVPGIPFNVLWTGSNWIVERCVREPVGSIIPMFVTALPTGFEWPNGQTLITTDYPEYAALRGNGTTPDLRQRTVFGTNLGAADPGLITSVIAATLGTAGGNQFTQSHNHNGVTGIENQGWTHSFSGTTSGQSADHTHGYTTPIENRTGGPSGNVTSSGAGTTSGVSNDHTHTFSGVTGAQNANHNHNIPNFGAGNAQNMPPAIVCNYALVVE